VSFLWKKKLSEKINGKFFELKMGLEKGFGTLDKDKGLEKFDEEI